jgi:hypothetical protein
VALSQLGTVFKSGKSNRKITALYRRLERRPCCLNEYRLSIQTVCNHRRYLGVEAAHL